MDTPGAGVVVWQGLAAGYEAWFESEVGAFVAARQLAAFERALPPLAPGRAADIGAGTGLIARLLGRRDWQVEAIEPAAAMRREGLARSAGLPLCWHDAVAERLPLPSATVDLAVFFTSLEFVADPVAALAEAQRVLRPGGWLVAGILDARSPWVALYRHLADHGTPPWNEARFFAPSDLERLVGRAADRTESAVFMGPEATPPYPEADAAGLRAGNHGSLAILCWQRGR